MILSPGQHLVSDTLAPGLRVARFTRPDNRAQLYDAEIEDGEPLADLRATVLGSLAAGDTVILNLGLVDRFPSRCYSLLLRARELCQAAQAKLVLCCLNENARECFTLFQGEKLFPIFATEEKAIASVRG